MSKIGIIYGSTTGTTEEIARKIATKLNVTKENIYDVSKVSKAIIKEYDVLLLGTSTWGAGDLQDDWYDGINTLKAADLSSKTIALFGCGDSESYSDTFCDGIGKLYEELKSTGCTLFGETDSSDYNFSSSEALVNGKLVGLAIDEINEDDKTDVRIENWTNALKATFLS